MTGAHAAKAALGVYGPEARPAAKWLDAQTGNEALPWFGVAALALAHQR